VATTLDKPLAVRALNRVGGALARVGMQPSLHPDDLERAAVRATGLGDFGEGSYREGLEQLTVSLQDEARLTTIGRIAARTRLKTLLETRLRLVDHRRVNPEVAHERIERPIFVLGLPRTGTTVLYGLLAADQRMRSPASWEVARPFPPPGSQDRTTDRRIAATEREFDQFRKVAPGIDRIHPLGAQLPQECLALQAPEFASYEFPTTFPVPSYWEWLRDQDLRRAYAFQKSFLQHLQSGYRGDHWILKTPAHLMWLDTLLAVFPDALIVHTHRDPATVLASVSSLMYALRSSVSDHVDPHDVGREQLDAWTWGLRRTLRAREHLPAERVVDVRFEDTVSDPVGTVARVYDHFGLTMTPAVEQGVRAYLDENPRTKHGVHRYDLADFGIDPDEAEDAFAFYREHFDVDEE
jgi:hypothetical protein